MADDHGHSHENEYRGRFSPLFPDSSKGHNETFIGQSLIPTSKIGASTSVQTANQLAEVEARLREGMRVVEIGTISPTTFEEIPKEHFKEMYQLSKLAGAEVTVHAPLIDPSGFPAEGRGWGGNEERQNAERQLKSIVQRAHEVNPKGVVPVTIHAAGMNVPANEWTKDEKGKIVLGTLYAINAKSGEVVPLRREKVFYPGEGERIETPQERLESINSTDWKNNKLQVVEMVRKAEEVFHEAESTGAPIIAKALKEGKLRGVTPDQRQKLEAYDEQVTRLQTYLQDATSRMASLYDHAKEFMPKDAEEKKHTQKILDGINEDWEKHKKEMIRLRKEGRVGDSIGVQTKLLNETFTALSNIDAPEIYKPVEEFAIEKASETLSNVAADSYSKFKENAPYVSIENVHPHVAFSKAETLRNLIEVSREKFVKKMEAQGMDTRKAEEAAEKMIGATWDVGHINMIRKFGYEEKDVVKETEKISKFVKHAHLHDNFGYHDSHLAPGMGNVPLKKLMESLKAQGYDGKAIIEAGAFAAQFKSSPHIYSLQALDSPVYYSATGGGPSWKQAQQYSSYFSGYGTIFPEQHFSMYGGGFSQLPTELGGRAGGGKGGRFSGTPME